MNGIVKFTIPQQTIEVPEEKKALFKRALQAAGVKFQQVTRVDRMENLDISFKAKWFLREMEISQLSPDCFAKKISKECLRVKYPRTTKEIEIAFTVLGITWE